jgi:hypothetical protein
MDKVTALTNRFKKISNYSPLFTFDAKSQIGGCFLEEKLKPLKKTATNLAGFKDNCGE